jgi:hypothetical protein
MEQKGVRPLAEVPEGAHRPWSMACEGEGDSSAGWCGPQWSVLGWGWTASSVALLAVVSFAVGIGIYQGAGLLGLGL